MPIPSIISFLFLVAVSTTATAQSPQDVIPSSTFPPLAEPDPVVERGDQAYDLYDNAAALEAYREAFQRDSLRYALMYRLSSAANDRGQDLLAEKDRARAEAFFREATGYARRMTERFPDRSGSWFQMTATFGNLALFAGGREKVRIGRDVEKWAMRAIELDSTNANAHLALGIFYREVGELNWFQRAAASALFGGVPDGGTEPALSSLDRARQLNPDLNMIHYELAVTYLNAERQEDALPHLREAARLPVLNTQEIRNRERARERLRQMGAEAE